MSVIRIAGLITLIAVLTILMWLKLSGFDFIEVGPIFPREPQGIFIQQPVITNVQNKILVDWIVPVTCKINEIELQEISRAGQSDWMGGTADCAMSDIGYNCQADLTDRGLLEGVPYRLQAHNAQCTGGGYVSEVVTFSL